jgi:hypothetical protein
MRAALAAIALALALGGCASAHTHRLVGTAMDLDEPRAALEAAVPAALRKGRPLPPIALSFALAPAPATPTAAAAEEEDVDLDARVLGGELVDALAATRVFASVFPVAAGDLQLAKEDARRKGASFLVEAVAANVALRRTERPIFIPIVTWLFTGYASLWQHNQTFALSFDLRLRLHDLNMGDVLPERPLEPGRARDELNFHERTSRIWFYLLPNVFPAPLLPADGDKIARELAPAALARPIAGFLAQLGGALDGKAVAFRAQHLERGPRVDVRYPPVNGEPVFLLKDTARFSVVLGAAEGRKIREVRMNGRLMFPVRSAVGEALRQRVAIEERLPLEAKEASVLFEAKDDAGGVSSCLIVSSAAP